MIFKDFRDFLVNLEKNGLLLRVEKETDIMYEIAAGIRKTSDINGPALLFENIKDYPGWKVVGGLFATPKLTAFALQTEEAEDKLLNRYLELTQKRVNPIKVESGPVKEVIIKGDDVDLSKLPIPIYCEMDSGPYLTAGVEIGKHPVTDIQDISIQRRAVLNKNTLGIMLSPTGHLGLMIRAAHENGKGLGIATAIGAHPALEIASQFRVTMGDDRMGIAGAVRGLPFELTKCNTIDVDVPADAEIIIEGITMPNERVKDGPFGEFPGNYISLGNYLTSKGEPTADEVIPVKVTAITMRKNAIFQAMLTGMPNTENHCLKKWALAAAIYRIATQIVPSPDDVRGVNLTVASAGFHVVVSVHKRAESTARNIIYTVLGSGILIGRVVVVDDDIDIYNTNEVEWAIATRVRPDRDIIIIPPAVPQPEAAIQIPALMYKWGIDATAPLTRESWLYRRAVPPGIDRVDYI